MPEFLKKKLEARFGTMNKIGAMHGNKETAKGISMERKHKAKLALTKTK